MSRPEFKSDFHGWQASDPTPQERSEGTDHTSINEYMSLLLIKTNPHQS